MFKTINKTMVFFPCTSNLASIMFLNGYLVFRDHVTGAHKHALRVRLIKCNHP